jgi:ABC-type sugar transport system permease subunit/ABC-type glycerol-3-phosphate transport system substrate-binding protein
MINRLLLPIVSFIILFSPTYATGAERETIVFWYGATRPERAAYEQMIREFMRANPDITVRAMLVPQAYMERKLLLSVAGGVPPDVVRFYTHLGGEMMSRGALEELDGLVQRDHFDLCDFYPVGLSQNTYKGRLYGIPWVLGPNALYYNKTMFRRAGLDPDKPPKTWDELKSYALSLTKRDENGVLRQVGYADFLYNPNNFATYLWQLGGDLLRRDLTKTAFYSSKGIAALTWMRSFIDKEAGGVRQLQVFAANFKGASQDPFGQGRLAMRIDNPFRMPDLDRYFPKLDYGVASIPTGGKTVSEVVGNALVIPRGSKHKEAAWRFIKFATSSEQMALICRAAGRIPARISAAHLPIYYNDAKLRVFVDQIEHGRSIPVVPGWQECSAELAAQIELALKGRKSPRSALSTAAQRADSILARANEDVSLLPPIPWKTLAAVASFVLASVCLGVVAYVRKATSHSKRELAEAKQFYLFAAPWLVGFVVFTFGTIVASFIISFSKWDTLSEARFVGLRNYAELFLQDDKFPRSVFVTFYYAVFSVPLAVVGGLAVSVLMNQKVMGIRVFRTIYYVPVVVAGVATSLLWQFIFNPTSGLMNKFLALSVVPSLQSGKLTFGPIVTGQPGWLLDPKLAMPAFIIMGFWSVGGAMVVYLAALQSVPEELYEAARIDGAGAWMTFRNVTLPLLTPAIFYQLVVGTMYSLQMFTQPYIMTPNGGPEYSTLFYALYLFKNGFEWMKFGYASAMAWVLLVIVLAITLIHFKASARWVYYEGQKEL